MLTESSEYYLNAVKFLKEFVDFEWGKNIEKGELYKRYKIWSYSNNMFCLGHAKFSIVAFKYFGSCTPKDGRDTHTKKRIWRNVAFKNVSVVAENS